MSSWEKYSGTPKEWNDFVLLKKGNHRQLYEWGEYKKATNWKVLRFVYRNGNNIDASVKIIFKTKFFINAIYIPGGVNGDIATLNEGFFDLLELSLDSSYYYIRSDFTKELCIEDENELNRQGWSRSIYKTHSGIYCELDLKKSNDELLLEASQKWRYHYKRSLKKETNLLEENNPQNFVSIHKELTDQRKHENFYTYREVEPLIKLLGEKLIIIQAKNKNNDLLALRSVITVGKKAWHHYSAVSNKGRSDLSGYRTFMHLLDVLRKKDIEYFNIGELNQDRWPGPYRFKLGIGRNSRIYNSLGEWNFSSSLFITWALDFYVRLHLRRHGASVFNSKLKK